MKNLCAAATLLVLPGSIAVAQPAKPSPPAERLGYYVGSWEGHGETKAGPFSEAGKLSSRMTCKWFTGGHQVVCEGEEMGPSGKRGFLNIIAYDEAAKAYTEYSISSFGEAEYDRGGTFEGDTLSWVVDQDVGGNPARFRYRERRVNPALMTYQAEVSVDGAPWTLLAEGEIKKVE